MCFHRLLCRVHFYAYAGILSKYQIRLFASLETHTCTKKQRI